MSAQENDTKELQYGTALLVALAGLLIPAILAGVLAFKSEWKPQDITTLVGLFTSTAGTLVGAFLGVQVGAAGKAKALDRANRALAALPPEKAKEVLEQG